MKTKTINTRHNTPLTYHIAGSQESSRGSSISLLNAYGVSLEAWQPLIAHLSRTHQVLIFECRGLQNSDAPSNDFVFGVEEQANDLREILDAENINETHIVAWCSGSKPAIVFNHHHPGRVASLTLIAPNLTPFQLDSECKTEWDINVQSASSLLRQNPEAASFFVDAIKTALENTAKDEAFVPQGRFGLLKLIGPKYSRLMLEPFLSSESLINHFKMLGEYFDYDISPFLKDINTPLQIVISTNDVISHPEQSRKVASMSDNIALLEYADTSHFLLLEEETDIPEQINLFISNNQHSVTH